MPFVSVIVVNWNKKELLERCLESLKNQTFRDYEVIVVDNGSTDDSPAMIRERFPEVRLITLDQNTGFSVGNNHGIRAAQGELIAFLNNDTEVDPHWLEELHRPLLAHSEVGSCASKMLFFKQRDMINSTGQVFYARGEGRDRGWMEHDSGQYDEASFIFGASCGAAIYRKSVLDEIGYFDEEFSPAYFEDVDLSFRGQLAGYKCLYVPKAVVYHHGRSTLGAFSSQRVYLCERNGFYVLVKNMPRKLVVKYAGKILAFSIALLFLRTIQVRGLSCLAGRLAAMKRLKLMLKKRRRIQTMKRVSDAYIDSVVSKKGLIPLIVRTVRQRFRGPRYRDIF